MEEEEVTAESPPAMSEESEEEEGSNSEVQSEENEDEEFDREKFIRKYQEAIENRSRAQKDNNIYQANLYTYFTKRQFKAQGESKRTSVSEQESTYIQHIDEMENFKKEVEDLNKDSKAKLTEYENELKEKELQVKDACDECHELRKIVSLRAVNSASGERMPKVKVLRYLSKLTDEEKRKRNVHLEYLNAEKALERAKEYRENLAVDNFRLTINDYELMICEANIRHARAVEKKKEVCQLHVNCSEAVNDITHLKYKMYVVEKHKMSARSKIRVLQQKNEKITNDIVMMKQDHETTTRVQIRKLLRIYMMIQDNTLPTDFERKKELDKKLSEEIDMWSSRYDLLVASRMYHQQEKKQTKVHFSPSEMKQS